MPVFLKVSTMALSFNISFDLRIAARSFSSSRTPSSVVSDSPSPEAGLCTASATCPDVD
ncbi:MAG: hypothetical protein R3B70_02225 [Polyangiaceae bacterium]